MTLACCALRSYRDRIAAPKGVHLKCADIFISRCALRNTDLDWKKGLFLRQHVCLPVSGKKSSKASDKRGSKSPVISESIQVVEIQAMAHHETEKAEIKVYAQDQATNLFSLGTWWAVKPWFTSWSLQWKTGKEKEMLLSKSDRLTKSTLLSNKNNMQFFCRFLKCHKNYLYDLVSAKMNWW